MLLHSGKARAQDPGAAARPTPQAVELTHQGERHARDGDEALALRRFADALALDPAYGPAYLGLGALHEAVGDLVEARRVYDAAVQHVPWFAPALAARARLLHRLGDHEGALRDLEAAAKIDDTVDRLRELADAYIAESQWPAALAVWRRIAVLADAVDAGQAAAARTQTRALQAMSGDLDPVTAGLRGRGWVRRAEAAISRRSSLQRPPPGTTMR